MNSRSAGGRRAAAGPFLPRRGTHGTAIASAECPATFTPAVWDKTGTRRSSGIQPADVQELVDRGCCVMVLFRGHAVGAPDRVACRQGGDSRLFTLGETPGVLWTPEDAVGARLLILMGHGGGQHKKAPGIVTRAAQPRGHRPHASASAAPPHLRCELLSRAAGPMRPRDAGSAHAPSLTTGGPLRSSSRPQAFLGDTGSLLAPAGHVGVAADVLVFDLVVAAGTIDDDIEVVLRVRGAPWLLTRAQQYARPAYVPTRNCRVPSELVYCLSPVRRNSGRTKPQPTPGRGLFHP